ncbi:MAG: FKBP-type peptidyl-prolyl cis-trans isomerase [Prevotella sp.]|nr:FKBP-type peptidyl-prolyl cis-trans isomerase [Prevotella sp.]
MFIIRTIAKLFKSPSLWEGLGVCLLVLFSSCSEEDAEATEFDNWKARNEVFFASLADSLSANPAQWQRILTYSLTPDDSRSSNDYIYAKKVVNGTGTECPAYTDSVRVAYRGRLIPSANYPDGYVFDETATGTFSTATAYTVKTVVSSNVDGYATALQHMHKGDTWRIYIPYPLGYGETDQTSGSVVIIPAYSVLVFDLALIDFCHAGETMPAWSSRISK